MRRMPAKGRNHLLEQRASRASRCMHLDNYRVPAGSVTSVGSPEAKTRVTIPRQWRGPSLTGSWESEKTILLWHSAGTDCEVFPVFSGVWVLCLNRFGLLQSNMKTRCVRVLAPVTGEVLVLDELCSTIPRTGFATRTRSLQTDDDKTHDLTKTMDVPRRADAEPRFQPNVRRKIFERSHEMTTLEERRTRLRAGSTRVQCIGNRRRRLRNSQIAVSAQWSLTNGDGSVHFQFPFLILH